MAKKPQHDAIIAVLVAHILEHGFSQTSLRQLANAADTSDRMLLYYFPDKEALMTALMTRLAEDLARQLETALPADVRLAPAELFRKGATLTIGAELQPYMQASLDIAALASRDEEPYARVSKAILAGFLSWIEMRLEGGDARSKKIQAAMILAMIDGLAVVSQGLKKAEIKRAIDGFAEALEAGD